MDYFCCDRQSGTMKAITGLFALCLGCGPSECDKYTTTFCDKFALCVSPIDTNSCEASTKKAVLAGNETEEQCKTANERIAPMTCSQFDALVATVTGR